MSAEGKGLTKKMGPLPMWAWGIIIGVGAYFLYTRYSSSSSTTAGTSAADPNAIDPNTGLTYGAEESAALNAAAGGTSTPAAGALDSSATTPDSFDQNLSNLESLLTFVQGIDPNFGGAGNTTGTGTGSSTPPMTGSTPPPTTPTTNTAKPSPVTTPSAAALLKGVGGTQAAAYIDSLAKQGYKFIPGTKGGGEWEKGTQKLFQYVINGVTYIRSAKVTTAKPATPAKAATPAPKAAPKPPAAPKAAPKPPAKKPPPKPAPKITIGKIKVGF